MKRTLIFSLAILMISFSSCKKSGKIFGKSHVSDEQMTTLIEENQNLQKRIRQDSMAYEREMEALKQEYEQKLANYQQANPDKPVTGYFVVVGSFKKESLAVNYASKIKAMGYEGNIIDGPNNFHCVTSATAGSLRDALPSLRTARSVVAAKAWIYFK